jgi:hypothetical protein
LALVPIRNIGQYGVNTDIDPLDLPITVFTAGSNVRFADNKISRGPAFGSVGSSTSNNAPRWSFSYRLQGQASTYLVMNDNGTVASLGVSSPGSPLVYTDRSVSGFTPSPQSLAYTATMLSNVVFVNRQDRVPWSMIPTGTQFTTLANWDSTWRCKALRSYNGCLVALNITKGAIEYPTMIKTSDFAPYGAVPLTWNAGLSNSATENVITDMTEPLVDGWSLREKFILYTTNETWMMLPTGDNLIYSYQRLFSNHGVINQNCIAELNNLHFVFGDNDIWMHDGFTPKSIAEGRVRRFIYENMLRSEVHQFFVWSNPKLSEILFCYVSNDPYCAFPVNPTIGYPGCNRAAVYNWQYDTWQFYDLPYIVGGGLGEMYSGVTYNDMTAITYETTSSSYQGLGDVNRLFSIAVGRGGSVTTPVLPNQNVGSWATDSLHLYSFELVNSSVGSGTLNPVVNAPPFVENIQMDMDDISKEVRGYKIVTSMYPEGRITDASYPMIFWYGSADYSGQTAVYGSPMSFDGQELYKLDFNSPGRYLSFRMSMSNTVKPFVWSGMDIEYKVTGHR